MWPPIWWPLASISTGEMEQAMEMLLAFVILLAVINGVVGYMMRDGGNK